MSSPKKDDTVFWEESDREESAREFRSPRYVDCDGTLIQIDRLIESILILLKQSPLQLALLPFWLLRGKVYFKQRIVEGVDLDMTLLPDNVHLLDFRRKEKSEGRTLVLVTASPQKFAQQIAVI